MIGKGHGHQLNDAITGLSEILWNHQAKNKLVAVFFHRQRQDFLTGAETVVLPKLAKADSFLHVFSSAPELCPKQF